MTAPSLLLLAGAPGVGKSTLMAALTAGCTRTAVTAPFAHDLLHPAATPAVAGTVVELGRRREQFAGTDALSLSVQPRVLGWLADVPHQLVLAEGDRLANLRFLIAAQRTGYQPHLVVLDAPGNVLDARCTQRGSQQSAAWRAGRATKVQRLAIHAEAARIPMLRLDTRHTNPAALANTVRRWHPTLTALLPQPGGPCR